MSVPPTWRRSRTSRCASCGPRSATTSLAQEAAKGGAKATNGTFAQGDVLGPKIAGVKLLATPDDAGKVAGTLARTDELVVIGEEKNGFVNVQGSTASGWVKIVLVQKR
jgi:hypothetical protein